MQTAGAPSYAMTSLYVVDLHPDVTEAMLFEKFSQTGPVLSIRVCRDMITRRSLGYAYVNFQQPADDNNKDMYDTFTTFGTILSCKLTTDELGKLKVYGFVHFETEEAANGMLLSDKKLYVGKFIPRKERVKEPGENPKRFTNVYLKKFTDDKLKDMFEVYVLYS